MKKYFGLIKFSNNAEIFGNIIAVSETTITINNPMVLMAAAGGVLDFIEYAPFNVDQNIVFFRENIVFGPVKVFDKIETLYNTYLAFYQTEEGVDAEGGLFDRSITKAEEFIRRFREKKEKEENGEEEVSQPTAYSREQLDANNITQESLDKFFAGLMTKNTKKN